LSLAGQAQRGLGDRLEHDEGYAQAARAAVAVAAGVHPGHRKLDVVERSPSACSDESIDLTQRRSRFLVPVDRGIDG
jgi:hypothetical protein